MMRTYPFINKRSALFGPFTWHFSSIARVDAVHELHFLKHAFLGQLQLRTGDQGSLHAFHRAPHGGFVYALILTQVRKGAILAPEFQRQEELFSHAERGRAVRFLLPSFAFIQHLFYLGKGFWVDPSASTKLLAIAIHLQRACQTVSLHPDNLAHDFRKRSHESKFYKNQLLTS
ncbi:hypothetical protein [Deinococcus sp. Arct2-2]|uniref:hypothetical protein n=1 Tax=Deinococcus sp. Arct2-2 TaxID=2568653 RepID=UPI001454D89F|nr:hypothetical protein [Deinococcus sp. Arct2-2]